MQVCVTPSADDVKDMFKIFFGEDTEASVSMPADLTDRHVATFVSDHDCLVAVLACDATFVAYSGAAFSLLPADVAAEMAKSKDFSEVVRANFHELMNICSRLLMSDTGEHLRLDKIESPDAGSSFIDELQPHGVLSGFQICIPGYGNGHMAVLAI